MVKRGGGSWCWLAGAATAAVSPWGVTCSWWSWCCCSSDLKLEEEGGWDTAVSKGLRTNARVSQLAAG